MSRIQTRAILLTVTLLIAPAISRTQEVGCGSTKYAELPVTYSSAGGVIIPASINDKPENVVLDLASAYGMLSRAALDELGLKVFHTSVVFSVGGQSSNEFTKVRELKLGSVRYPGWDLLVYGSADQPLQKIDAGEPIGSIGSDLFRYFDLELDLGHDKVRIFSHERCGDASPVYWTSRYDMVPLRPSPLKTVYFVMQVDGKNLETTLATNSGTTSIFTEVTKLAYGWDETAPQVQGISGGGGGTEQRYRAMSLTAPGLKVVDANIRLVKEEGCIAGIDRDGAYGFRDCFGIHPLTLGVDVLKKLRIYMAMRAEKMWVTAWDAQ
jgi:Aspartyl protease